MANADGGHTKHPLLQNTETRLILVTLTKRNLINLLFSWVLQPLIKSKCYPITVGRKASLLESVQCERITGECEIRERHYLGMRGRMCKPS